MDTAIIGWVTVGVTVLVAGILDYWLVFRIRPRYKAARVSMNALAQPRSFWHKRIDWIRCSFHWLLDQVTHVHWNVSATLVLMGLLLAYVGQQMRGNTDTREPASLVFLGVGVLLVVLGIQDQKNGWLSAWAQKVLVRFHIRSRQGALIILSAILSILATYAAGPAAMMRLPAVAIISWLFAAGLAVIAFWPKRTEGQATTFAQYRSALLWTAFFIVLAMPARLIQLGNAPISLSGDEGSSGLAAVDFLNGNMNNLFTVGWFSFPSLYFFVQSLFVHLFGHTTFALRVGSALIGAVTVGMVYLFGRAMFHHRVGVLAAIFLAFSHFHIAISRTALNNIWDGFFYVVTLGAFWYGWERQSRKAFIVAGIALGLSQYFYTSAHMLPVLLILSTLVFCRLKIPIFRRQFGNLFTTAWLGLVIFLPLGWFFFNHVTELTAPMDRVKVTSEWIRFAAMDTGRPEWMVMLDQFKLSLQAYTDIPARGIYLPNEPILLVIPAVIFLCGIVLLLLRAKENRSALLLLWVASFAVIGTFSTDTPAIHRYIASAPALALVIGFAMQEISASFAKLWPHWQRAVWVVSLLAMAWIVSKDLNVYFGTYIPEYSMFDDHTQVAQDMANYFRDMPDGTKVYFFGDPGMGYFSIPSTMFLRPQVTGNDILIDWGSADTPFINPDRSIFIFLDNHLNDLAMVRKQFPQGRLIIFSRKDGSDLVWFYDLTHPTAIPDTATRQ